MAFMDNGRTFFINANAMEQVIIGIAILQSISHPLNKSMDFKSIIATSNIAVVKRIVNTILTLPAARFE